MQRLSESLCSAYTDRLVLEGLQTAEELAQDLGKRSTDSGMHFMSRPTASGLAPGRNGKGYLLWTQAHFFCALQNNYTLYL